jgi:predicted metal-dependent peptidase
MAKKKAEVEESKALIPYPSKEEIEKYKAAYEDATIETNTKLEKAVFRLLDDQPFVGHLIQQLTRQISDEIPTACVSVKDNKYALTVNPFHFNRLNSDENVAILKHEVFHLLNEHLKRLVDKHPRMWNVAADIAINQYIPNLPRFVRAEAIAEMVKLGFTEAEAEKQLPKADADGKCCDCLLPEQYGLEREKTAEYYYEKVLNNKEMREKFDKKTINLSGMSKEEQEKLKQDIKDGKVRITVTAGDHADWGDMDGSTPEIIDEELKRMIRDAMEKSTKSFGLLPSELQRAIMELLQSKINWKSRLRSFVQVATHIYREKSRKRPSRRYGIAFPGQKSEYKLNLGVVVDTSGSIGEQELALFAGEINRIFETGIADVTVLEADASVHKTYKLKKKFDGKASRFCGGGGTAAQPWIDALDKNHLDAGIILTDGFFDLNLKKSKAPILWCLTETGVKVEEFEKSVKFGRKVQLETEDGKKKQRLRY